MLAISISLILFQDFLDHLEWHNEEEVSRKSVTPATVSRSPGSPATDPRLPDPWATLPDKDVATEDSHAQSVGRYSHLRSLNSTDFLPLDHQREYCSDQRSRDTREVLPVDPWESGSDRIRPDSIEIHHNSHRHRRGESQESSQSIECESLQGERQSHSGNSGQYTDHYAEHYNHTLTGKSQNDVDMPGKVYNHRLTTKMTSENDLDKCKRKVHDEQNDKYKVSDKHSDKYKVSDKQRDKYKVSDKQSDKYKVSDKQSDKYKGYDKQSDKCKSDTCKSDKCNSGSHSRRRYGLIGLVRDLQGTEPGVSDSSDRVRSISAEVGERSMSAEVRQRSMSAEVKERSTSAEVYKSSMRRKHKDEKDYSHSRSERKDRYCIHPN